ncbi:hypothetical protein HDV00_004508 [Rhizophlyctis rosea]|nr:hypothetical protein HDV00_004508 [Rhizophlyctis rosea]
MPYSKQQMTPASSSPLQERTPQDMRIVLGERHLPLEPIPFTFPKKWEKKSSPRTEDKHINAKKRKHRAVDESEQPARKKLRNDDYTISSSDSSENEAPKITLPSLRLSENSTPCAAQGPDPLPTPFTPSSDGDESRDSYFTAETAEIDEASTSFSSSINSDEETTSDTSQEDPLWCDEDSLYDEDPTSHSLSPPDDDDDFFDTENVKPIHTPRVQTPITGMSPNVRNASTMGTIPPTPGLHDIPFKFGLSPSFGSSPKLLELRSSSRPHTPVRAQESRSTSPRYGEDSATSSPVPARVVDFHLRALDIKPGTEMRPVLREHLSALQEVADIDIVFEQWDCDDERETVMMKHRRGDWLLKHPRLNQQYRWILINWMNDVANEHRLQRRTFHIAVNYLDIYMSKSSDIQQDTFQLLGAAMLFIAAKMEEAHPLVLDYLVEFVAEDDMDNCTRHHIIQQAKNLVLKYEAKLLKWLDWDVAIPNANDYLLRYFQQAALYQRVLDMQAGKSPAQCEDAHHIMRRQFHGQDFAEAAQRLDDAVTDYASVKFRNGVLAASVFHLTYGRGEEKFTELITSYSIAQLRDCIAWVQDIMEAEAVSDASSDAQPASEGDPVGGAEVPDVIDHQPKASRTLNDMMQVWDQCDKGMG